MSAKFSLSKLLKGRRSKKTGEPEALSGRHPLDGPTAPPVVPACDTETLMALGLFQTQNPSVAAFIDGGDSTKAASSSVAKPQAPSNPPGADPEAKEPQPVTEPVMQLSISQKLWNEAYDSLEDDNETAKLVMSYVKTLTIVLEAKKTPDTSASGTGDVSAELKDPTKREELMKELVKAGIVKISKASKIANAVGTFAQSILLAKEMIDPAIGNIPQAALPWAGVCVGLQVSTHSLYLIAYFSCH